MRLTINHDKHDPGHVLNQECIKLSGESYESIELKYNIQYPRLLDVVKGKKRITPLFARQLQSIFGTSTRYWLDIQTSYELNKILLNKLNSDNSIARSIEKFRIQLEERKYVNCDFLEPQIHPGKILLKFIETSELGVNEWSKILFIKKNELDSILKAKKELSTIMIIKLSRIFNTDIIYWIDLNHKYLSQLVNERYLE